MLCWARTIYTTKFWVIRILKASRQEGDARQHQVSLDLIQVPLDLIAPRHRARDTNTSLRANVAADRPIVSSGGWDNWVPRTDPHQCAARFTYGSSQGAPSGAKSNPNRERLPFKQRDVGRALAGVLSKGLSIEKVEIHPSTGMITITTGKAGSQQAA